MNTAKPRSPFRPAVCCWPSRHDATPEPCDLRRMHRRHLTTKRSSSADERMNSDMIIEAPLSIMQLSMLAFLQDEPYGSS